jgi:hypothetical protein
MLKQVLIWTLFTLFCLFTGCAQKQVTHEPICLANLDLQSAMKQSELVLLRMNFFVDKSDAATGFMHTKPLPGSQFFEIWRRDNRDGYSAAMANIHTIRRTVVLNFMPQNDLLCIDCNVTIERLSIPEKEINSSAKAFSIFSKSNESQQTLRVNTEQEKLMEWVDMGRDSSLEALILKKINQKIIKGKK